LKKFLTYLEFIPYHSYLLIIFCSFSLLGCKADFKSNRLGFQKSPYLLQHKENPIWWQPWEKETLDYVKKSKKLVFLSIGYSTCHWCHVMERESFETLEVADVLNRSFIAIKIDREERPEIDKRYMNAIQLMGKRGGWPLSMFLTPDMEPIWGGTYIPKQQFIQILSGLSKQWGEDKKNFLKVSKEIAKFLDRPKELDRESIKEEILKKAFNVAGKIFDKEYGGFGSAPKFPSPMRLRLLMRMYERSTNLEKKNELKVMIEKTLKGMFRGGLYDHIGGGFSRYSTDRKWLIPHFEKMLYDNAQLIMTYLEAFQLFKDPIYAQISRDILDYVLREMTSKEGAFFSAQDADSENEEGKFYVWTKKEIKKILNKEELDLFLKTFAITEKGNFEHHTNHLNLLGHQGPLKNVFGPKIKKIKNKLLRVRSKRIPPLKDTKFLTAWNGLMIGAMAKGGQVLGEPKYLKAARQAALFIKKNLNKEGRLFRRYMNGEAENFGLLDDYSYLIDGLLHLYQAEFDSKILKWAIDLQNQQDKNLWSKKLGVYFFSMKKDDFPFQTFELADNARPNSNAMSALNLLKIYGFTYNTKYLAKAKKVLRAVSKDATKYPLGFSQGLLASNYYLDFSKEVVIVGPKDAPLTQKFLNYFREHFDPNRIVYFKDPNNVKKDDFVPLPIVNKEMLEGQPTVYVCKKSFCKYPTSDFKVFKNFVKERKPLHL
jgi:uncharacterized protein YyaL (SSP411 family)